MTKEEIIDSLELYTVGRPREDHVSITVEELQNLIDEIKTLEQQPSDDTITITMNKGTLKYSGHGYVVYKKDWFRKHFATEVEIMTGYDGYKLKLSHDCVSRQAVKDAVTSTIAPYIPTFIGRYEKIPLELAVAIRDIPPVIPTPVWTPVSSESNKVSWPSLEDLRERLSEVMKNER